MKESPVNSFIRFFAGFVLLISLSFGITYTVNSYTTKNEAAAAMVAAQSLLLKQAPAPVDSAQ
jgi:ABC-type uncharacterized transport system permease subunit